MISSTNNNEYCIICKTATQNKELRDFLGYDGQRKELSGDINFFMQKQDAMLPDLWVDGINRGVIMFPTEDDYMVKIDAYNVATFYNIPIEVACKITFDIFTELSNSQEFTFSYVVTLLQYYIGKLNEA